jgi:CRP-like cAMP-binding protein
MNGKEADMIVRANNEILKTMNFLRGLNDEELTKIGDQCKERSFEAGELCQHEGEPVSNINFIIKGKAGVEFHIPSIAYGSKDIILYTVSTGEIFGWSALIQGTPWSTMRVLEQMDVLYIRASDLMNLCENNYHIGYILMKNLSSLISSRLRRNRIATLNALVAIKGEW